MTLTNSGSFALNISSIISSGDFVQNNACPDTLAVSASCTIYVSFRPTASGSRTSSISINDNAAGSPQMAGLTGVGTVVSLEPATLSFGNQTVGATDSNLD